MAEVKEKKAAAAPKTEAKTAKPAAKPAEKAAAKPAPKAEVKAAPAAERKVYVAPKEQPKKQAAAAGGNSSVSKPAAPKASAPKAAEPTKAASPAAAPKAAAPKAETTAKVKNPKAKAGQYIATGRRKKSVARVRLYDGGKGKITINNMDIDEYLDTEVLKLIVRQPLALTKTEGRYDIIVNVYGGGKSGQAGAIRHGIARGLAKENEQMHAELKKGGFLTRDSRMKERKKYGLKKARRASQFSKR